MKRYFDILLLTGLLSPFHADAKPAAEIVSDTSQSIVRLQTLDAQGRELSTGTGFVISTDGIVLTCAHVIKGAASVNAINGHTSLRTNQLIAIDESRDVAALKFPNAFQSKLSFGLSQKVRVGDSLLVVGYPLGLGLSASDGILAAVLNESPRLLQLTNPISPGSSGSPVFDADGQVIGMAFMSMEKGQSLNFAISAEELQRAVSQHSKAESVNLTTFLRRKDQVMPTVLKRYDAGELKILMQPPSGKQWQVVRSKGVEYVTLGSVHKFYGFVRFETGEREDIRLVGPKLVLRFEEGSRRLLINGVPFLLQNPTSRCDGRLRIAKRDLLTLVEPVLRPGEIAKKSTPFAFSEVVIDVDWPKSSDKIRPHVEELVASLNAQCAARGLTARLTSSPGQRLTLAERDERLHKAHDSVVIALEFPRDEVVSGVFVHYDPAPLNTAFATALGASLLYQSRFGLTGGMDGILGSPSGGILSRVVQPAALVQFSGIEFDPALVAKALVAGVVNFRIAVKPQ